MNEVLQVHAAVPVCHSSLDHAAGERFICCWYTDRDPCRVGIPRRRTPQPALAAPRRQTLL